MISRLLAILVAVVAARPVTAAEPLPRPHLGCLLALESAGARVGAEAGRHALGCVRAVVQGRRDTTTLTACLAMPPRALRRAEAGTRAAIRWCRPEPAFGPADAREVNAGYSAITDLTALFGPQPATSLRPAALDPATARCQLAATRALAELNRAELTEYRRCVRKRLVLGEMASAADLATCLDVDTGTVRTARERAARRLAVRCEGVPLARALPGRCAEAEAGSLGACLAEQAYCGYRTAVNRADRLGLPRHVFEAGVATRFCGDRPPRGVSVARQWNEEILAAIRLDNPRPPVHARNLFHLSVAMYDAWAAYDGRAKPYLAVEHPRSTDPARDRAIAISFAAYRLLVERYSKSLALGHAAARARFDQRMSALGLDGGYTATEGDGPAAVGNRIARAVLAFGHSDGANEAINYADWSYRPVNRPLLVKRPDIDLTDPADPGYRLDPNRWQPLALNRTISQNGIPLPDGVQSFIGSHWDQVTPFALTRADPAAPYLDPGPPPRLGGATDAIFKAELLQMLERASELNPDDPTEVDISPAALGQNPLGSNAGNGYPLNPLTGRPYTPQRVLRGDFGRVLAEYWADGPHSETPPGHWNLIANAVADSPGFERRLAGRGAALDPLEWDVKTYLALNGALHDAAIVAWGVKRKYDGVRPITMVRAMAKYGQCSDPSLPSYSPLGLPLKAGLVELITAETAAPGGRHAALVAGEAGGRVGDIAVWSWPGSPPDPRTQTSGIRWVLGKAWVPYQRDTFVTPAFPGYISGHSTFSRAAAEVLTALTGSEFFPGGLYEGFVAEPGRYLIHEKGPVREVRLQWASYYDAADQAGQSRIFGGIHVAADDFAGRRVGREIGRAAWARALIQFEGTR